MSQNKETKKKLLIIGITMQPAGTEKSFLSFASCLDYDRYDVTLLLAKKDGMFLPLIPKQIHVVEMEQYDEMFTLHGGNAMRVIWNTMVKKNPLLLADILPFAFQMVLHRQRHADLAMGMWCRLEKRFPDFHMPEIGEFDAAVAYWGDKTMFYMLDHVKAKKKIAWLHFDYTKPQRDDTLYEPAFSACDAIVTVSHPIETSLKEHFPLLAQKIVCMENILDPKMIWDLALRGETFPDIHFTGKRILTVGRIAEQKGYDMVVEVLSRLRSDGYNVRWYIVGGGEEEAVDALKVLAVEKGVADLLILLGNTMNPYTYMRDCDIYAQPSRHEGKPIAVEEAKILYKTILTTDYLSSGEQLDGGNLGEICEISVDGIYEGIKKLLDNPFLCECYSDRLTEMTFGNTDEMNIFESLMNENTDASNHSV
ncbi:MAG: glycosyltransferase [Clostridia bacterium]|nr:glycosyltransferase [Clostridia bacterium]